MLGYVVLGGLFLLGAGALHEKRMRGWSGWFTFATIAGTALGWFVIIGMGAAISIKLPYMVSTAVLGFVISTALTVLLTRKSHDEVLRHITKHLPVPGHELLQKAAEHAAAQRQDKKESSMTDETDTAAATATTGEQLAVTPLLHLVKDSDVPSETPADDRDEDGWSRPTFGTFGPTQ